MTMPTKLTVESVIAEFRNDIYGDSDALFDRSGNNVSTQVENWLKEKLTTLQTQHREEVESLKGEIEFLKEEAYGDNQPN